MKTRVGYTPAQTVYPLQGLNTREPSTLTDPHYGVVCDNVTCQKGILAKRRGLRSMGDQTALDGGAILALIPFRTEGGQNITVACTAKRQYMYDASGDAWADITGPAAGSEVEWTGTDDDPIQWCVATDNDGTWLYITNGVDMPRRWDGSTATFVDIDSAAGWNFTDFDTCKTLSTYNGSLVMGNITTAGANQPKVVAWSDTANFSEWQVGNSGLNLLADTDGEIWRLLPMGERLIIYSSNSIGAVTYIGGDILFAFEVLVNRTQLLSPMAAANLGPVHVYASEENIYLFDGTRLPRSVGDIVQQGYREDVTLDIAPRAFVFNDSIESQLYFGVPVDDETTYIYVCDYDLKDMSQIRFVRHAYAGRMTALGYLTRDGILSWDQLGDTTWDDWAGPWEKRTAKGAFPVRVAGTAAGAVFMYDDSNYDDAGQAVSAVWESIDFTVPADYVSSYARFNELEIELRGVMVDVSINTGKGDVDSWETIEEGLELTGDWQRYKIPFDAYGEAIRVRLSNAYASSGFEMRWLRAWFIPGGPE